MFNLTLHDNFTPSGLKAPAFPGAVVSHQSLNGVPEWALGVTNWFEAGRYMPLYSHDQDLGWGSTASSCGRCLPCRVPTTASSSTARISSSATTPSSGTRPFTEVRPIVGWHFKAMDLIINPILDTLYDGFKNMEFAPSTRVAHNFQSGWALAIEEYADCGPISGPHTLAEQSQQLYGVVDHTGGALDCEFGVGVGLNDASDKVTIKLILSRDLNKSKTGGNQRHSANRSRG